MTPESDGRKPPALTSAAASVGDIRYMPSALRYSRPDMPVTPCTAPSGAATLIKSDIDPPCRSARGGLIAVAGPAMPVTVRGDVSVGLVVRVPADAVRLRALALGRA